MSGTLAILRCSTAPRGGCAGGSPSSCAALCFPAPSTCSPSRSRLHTHIFLPATAVLSALNQSQTKTGKSLILLLNSSKLLVQTVPQTLSPPPLPPSRPFLGLPRRPGAAEVRRFGCLELGGSGARRGGSTVAACPPPAARPGVRGSVGVARRSRLAWGVSPPR